MSVYAIRRTLAGGIFGIAIGLTGVSSAAEKLGEAPLISPPGVTIVDVVSDQLLLWRRLGDAEGNPLYTYDLDPPGKATCAAECAKEFPPLFADKSATAFDAWSLVARENGAKQWAYRDRPLYLYSGEDPSLKKGGGRGGAAQEKLDVHDPGSKLYSPKEGWKRAAIKTDMMPLPAEVKLTTVATANGYAFVVPDSGLTMYTFKTAPKNANDWTPVYAPGLARNVGDFSVLAREDGKGQWAHKGRLLYTFAGDYGPGDINGLIAQRDAQVALAYRNYMPPSIKIDILPFRGPIMVTAQGMTIYTQTQQRRQYGLRETRNFRYGYKEAKTVGPRGCEGECLKTWRPVLAPEGAQARGFWEITTRSDGSRQWAYKGASLYTFVGDEAPGDTKGNSQHEIVFGAADNEERVKLAGGDADAGVGSGFYWSTVALFD